MRGDTAMMRGKTVTKVRRRRGKKTTMMRRRRGQKMTMMTRRILRRRGKPCEQSHSSSAHYFLFIKFHVLRYNLKRGLVPHLGIYYIAQIIV
jgi:hypothetical protein